MELPLIWNAMTLMWRHYILRWRHNDHDSVSNHQPHGCLLNRLFRRRSKKTSKLRVTGLCVGNSPGTGEFPAQMASYAENVSIWWRHHDDFLMSMVSNRQNGHQWQDTFCKCQIISNLYTGTIICMTFSITCLIILHSCPVLRLKMSCLQHSMPCPTYDAIDPYMHKTHIKVPTVPWNP